MRSSLPKPLHRLCGRPMILHVIDALAELDVQRVVVVVGHGGDQVTKTVSELAPEGLRVEFVEQVVQRGTGDAAAVALSAFSSVEDDDDVVVLPTSEHARLESGKVEIRIHGAERHGRNSRR